MNTINIKALSEQVARIDGKVGSIPVGKIPKDYSTTETDTGLKWIDGKAIYCKVYTGNIPAITSNTNITLDEAAINLVYTHGTVSTSGDAEYDIPFYSTSALTAYVSNDPTNHLYVRVGTTFSEGKYKIICYYTKITTNEPTTKATRKKSTK